MPESSESIISWNLTNWVTILLMVAVGFAGLGLAIKVIQKRRITTSASN
jgi:hypothetical protein